MDKKIKETNSYVEIHFIVGGEKDGIVPEINIHRASIMQIANAITCLKAITGQIQEKYPLAKEIAEALLRADIEEL